MTMTVRSTQPRVMCCSMDVRTNQYSLITIFLVQARKVLLPQPVEFERTLPGGTCGIARDEAAYLKVNHSVIKRIV